MHREHFSKSKTKKEGSLEHYYVEIKPKERQIYLIDWVATAKD